MNEYVGGNEFPECFPKNFINDILPKGASPRELEVYHICIDGVIHKESFLSSYEYKQHLNRPSEDDPNDPGTYSTSCYTKRKDIKNSLKSWRRHSPSPIIVQGKTNLDSGLVQPTKERKHCSTSHVDWWIYKDKDVSDNFVDKTAEFDHKEEKKDENS